MRFSIPTRLRSSAGFAALLLVSGLAIWQGLLAGPDNSLLDAGFRLNRQWFPQPVANDPVIVGINENFLDSIDEPMALDHAYLAEFLRAVSQAGPQVIGMDMLLPDKRFNTLVSTRHPELDFHRTLLMGLLQSVQNTALVVVKVWNPDAGHYYDIQTDYASVLSMQGKVQGMASAMFCLDRDGGVREYPGQACQKDHSEHSFANEISAAMGNHQSWSGLINYQLGGEFTYIPIQTVLKLAEQGNTARLKELFAGKAVLLGAILDENDLLTLPVPLAEWRPRDTRVPGVLAHAQVLRSMLNQGFVQPMPALLIWLLCAAFALFWFGDSVLRKLLLFSVAAATVLAAADFLLWQGFWLPPSAILLTGLFAFGGRGILTGWRHFREKQRLSRTFSGSVSPAVMQEIVGGGLDASSKGRKVPVCVLFSDIRNFTSLSEKLPPEEVVNLLNRYFARMAAVVHRHGGTVDKFIGDGMMAYFGAPNRLISPEKSALEAAHDMLMALDELNGELADEGRPPIGIGIGLHSGDAVVGYIGSPEKHEYTAIGDTVNTASRIEGLCKNLGHPIICSESVAQAVGYPAVLVNLGEQHLKGRSSIVVYGWQSAVTATVAAVVSTASAGGQA